MTTQTLSEFKDELRFLESCCLTHPQNYSVDMVEGVDWWEPSDSDTEGFALFRLSGGLWGVLIEMQDSTGHG